ESQSDSESTSDSESQSDSESHSDSHLPDTGEEESNKSGLIGAGLAALGGLSIFGRRRKKNSEQ
uniref:LPXTG cell wall anchor domain-containing protein n=1 Tax=Staphylococcus haemolyticus TaxID=1283 RepID=UPI000B288A55